MNECKEQAIIRIHAQKAAFSWYYVQKIHGSTILFTVWLIIYACTIIMH